MPTMLRPEKLRSKRTTHSVDRCLAFAVFRLTLGVNMLIHGLVRLPDLDGFAGGLVEGFAETPLPPFLVEAFATALPVAEAAVGALLILGLLTRWALLAGGLLITALVFGTALRQQWDTLGLQMIYALAYFLLHFFIGYNRFSMDRLFRRNGAS